MRTFFCALFVMVLVASGSNAEAQEEHYDLADTIRMAIQLDPRFVGRLETTNAFVTGRPVRTYAVKGGVAYGRYLTVGLGYHWLQHGDTYAYRLPGGMEELRELRMAYVAGFVELSFMARKNLEVTFPFELGLGTSREFRPDEGVRKSFNRAGILVYQPGMVLEYHFLRYFAAGAGVGLRLMAKNNQNIDQQFTAPTWQLRFRVKFGDIWNDIKPYFEED